MSGEPTIAVPVGTLRLLLSRCRAGLVPMVAWSESKAAMDQAAMQRRGEALAEIESEISELLPPEER